MNKKETAIAAVLTLAIAFMDITGIPSTFFVNIQIMDIEPVYFAFMVNFLIICLLACFVLRYLCPEWKLGLSWTGLGAGIKRYGLPGLLAALMGFAAFYLGSRPFDLSPSIYKVLVEGVIYYIGVAIVEELYVRGLLLNLIEHILYKNKNATTIAVLLSASIFGVGHIFGALNQPIYVIASKVVWTTGMGIFFGAIYKKSGNLWLPIMIHFLINVCALPYCFSSKQGYANLTLCIVLPTYILLGMYGLKIIKQQNDPCWPGKENDRT